LNAKYLFNYIVYHSKWLDLTKFYAVVVAGFNIYAVVVAAAVTAAVAAAVVAAVTAAGVAAIAAVTVVAVAAITIGAADTIVEEICSLFKADF
jgi:hypothetical protein